MIKSRTFQNLMRSILLIALIVFSLSIPLLANPMAPRWRLINSSAPARYNHKCAYDIDRGKVVLFGGLDSTQAMPDDIWEFAMPGTWTQIQASGPEGRAGHGLCYDTAAHVTILFGGQNREAVYLNDTWSWNGSQWTKLDSTGPSPRAYFSMTYDSQRKRIVLFGGDYFDAVFEDTWEWDGSHWSPRAFFGPPLKLAADMAYDDQYDYTDYPPVPIGRCILFGGQFMPDGPATNDTWAWDGNAWTEIVTPEPPSARVGHSMGFCWFPGGITLFGGQSATIPDTIFGITMYLYTGVGGPLWERAYAEVEPPARSLSAMVTRGDGESVMLIGGENGATIYHDVWIFPVFYSYTVGDVNDNGETNGLDIVYEVNYFKGGPPPPYEYECSPGNTWHVAGDVNASCDFNGLDVTYMVSYFKGGPPLHPCPDCPP